MKAQCVLHFKVCWSIAAGSLAGSWFPNGIKRDKTRSIRVDGALVDEYRLTHGFWEAKDTARRSRQRGKEENQCGLSPKQHHLPGARTRDPLAERQGLFSTWTLLNRSRSWKFSNSSSNTFRLSMKTGNEAVEHFQDQVPELGEALERHYRTRSRNQMLRFRAAFDDFFALCRQSINPNLSKEAVEEMLIQHLLTERIFRTVFNNPDFTRRNVIAAEIEKVIDALTSQAFSRDAFCKASTAFTEPLKRPPGPSTTSRRSKSFSTRFMKSSSRASRLKLPTRTASSIRQYQS